MPIGAASYRQVCTYWATQGMDGFGKPIFSAPVLKKCRWEDSNERYINDEGLEALSRAQVWTYEPMETDGWVVLGDHSGVVDPTGLPKAWRIKRSDEIPDLRGLNRENLHYL